MPADLRDVVARVFDPGAFDYGIVGSLTRETANRRNAALIKADAVLAAIREEHVIVTRPGEDVAVEDAFDVVAAELEIPIGIATRSRLRKTLQIAAPIITAHARAAALEEAAKPEAVKAAMAALSEEERCEIMCDYCHYCGGPSGCQCWNDE